MKRLFNIIIIGLILILPIIIFIFDIKFDCLIKKYLHFACPSCGLTRAITEILRFDIIESLKYNVLALPLILLAIYSVISLIINTLKNNNNYINKATTFFTNHYKLIITILLINTLINNFRNI